MLFISILFKTMSVLTMPFITMSFITRFRPHRVVLPLFLLAGIVWGQQAAPDKANDNKADSHTNDKLANDKQASARAADRNREAEESSSHDTRIDTRPPKDDAKNHPMSAAAVSDMEAEDNPDLSGVQEFHPWNPMKALKDVEVGDFYFKRKNYKAALDRYKEALYYKDNDAVASFRLAVCQDKLGDKAEAKKYYEQYLKILPDGPFAKDAHASLERLEARK
jgi:tetratricopeptide (TPR) repeat protein